MSHFGPQGDITKVWECPAFMSVPIVNEAGKSKWVLFISAGHPQKGYVGMQYFVGDFDGTHFTLDKENPKSIAPGIGNVVDYGKDYYAAIQYNNLPAQYKNPVMIGWLNNWEYGNKLPTMPFKGAMSLPYQIALKRTVDGLQLVQQPINSSRLRGEKIERQNVTLTNQSLTLEKHITNSYEINAEILVGTAKRVGIRLAKNGREETIIQYANGKLELDRRKSGQTDFSDRFPSVEQAPVKPQNGIIKLRIFVDKSVVEVFVNNALLLT